MRTTRESLTGGIASDNFAEIVDSFRVNGCEDLGSRHDGHESDSAGRT